MLAVKEVVTGFWKPELPADSDAVEFSGERAKFGNPVYLVELVAYFA
jgi:hypothetical protein